MKKIIVAMLALTSASAFAEATSQASIKFDREYYLSMNDDQLYELALSQDGIGSCAVIKDWTYQNIFTPVATVYGVSSFGIQVSETTSDSRVATTALRDELQAGHCDPLPELPALNPNNSATYLALNDNQLYELASHQGGVGKCSIVKALSYETLFDKPDTYSYSLIDNGKRQPKLPNVAQDPSTATLLLRIAIELGDCEL